MVTKEETILTRNGDKTTHTSLHGDPWAPCACIQLRRMMQSSHSPTSWDNFYPCLFLKSANPHRLFCHIKFMAIKSQFCECKLQHMHSMNSQTLRRWNHALSPDANASAKPTQTVWSPSWKRSRVIAKVCCICLFSLWYRILTSSLCLSESHLGLKSWFLTQILSFWVTLAKTFPLVLVCPEQERSCHCEM